MIDNNILKKLEEILSKEQILTSPEDLICYSYDATPLINYKPDAVVIVKSAEEISKILTLANQTNTKIIPRGSGTGLSGGSIAVQGGIILQLTKLNKILEIDTKNLTALVESGVITSALQETVEEKGLFYPPDPGSVHSSTIGGNAAENAGGLRGLKYGVTKDYILGLETVLPTGEIIQTGNKTIKDVAGYDLTKLLVGSEGTLGIFTKILVKLIPLPQYKKTALVYFEKLINASGTVSQIISSHILPCTLEIMDSTVINCVEDYIKIGLPRTIEAILLIECDGNKETVESDFEKIIEICKNNNSGQINISNTEEESLKLTSARRASHSALARKSITNIAKDISIPRSKLTDAMTQIQSVKRKYNLTIGIYGHAGDGNLHVTALTDERNKEELQKVEFAFEEILEIAVKLGGTITGEHGIGIEKLKFLPKAIGKTNIELMKGIKKVFDPNNILNPGKIF